jgi:3-hydroxybutyryl-CoA dehydratase
MQHVEGYFEDFQTGTEFVTQGRTITEADVVSFAGLSGDFNQIHINAAYAASTQFGQRIAHGLLVVSIASGLAVQMGVMGDKVEAFRSLEWKFSAPVFIGDTIHCELTIGETKVMKRLGVGSVDFEVRVIKQDGSTVMRGNWLVLLKLRPASA